MYPKSFEYISPTNIDDVISLLDKYKEDAKLISGGHSLIPLMKLRLVSPQIIVDLNNVSGYDNIALNQNMLSIGSRVTHHEIEISNLLKEKCYMLLFFNIINFSGSRIARIALKTSAIERSQFFTSKLYPTFFQLRKKTFF